MRSSVVDRIVSNLNIDEIQKEYFRCEINLSLLLSYIDASSASKKVTEKLKFLDQIPKMKEKQPAWWISGTLADFFNEIVNFYPIEVLRFFLRNWNDPSIFTNSLYLQLNPMVQSLFAGNGFDEILNRRLCEYVLIRKIKLLESCCTKGGNNTEITLDLSDIFESIKKENFRPYILYFFNLLFPGKMIFYNRINDVPKFVEPAKSKSLYLKTWNTGVSLWEEDSLISILSFNFDLLIQDVDRQISTAIKNKYYNHYQLIDQLEGKIVENYWFEEHPEIADSLRNLGNSNYSIHDEKVLEYFSNFWETEIVNKSIDKA